MSLLVLACKMFNEMSCANSVNFVIVLSFVHHQNLFTMVTFCSMGSRIVFFIGEAKSVVVSVFRIIEIKFKETQVCRLPI